MKHKEWYEILRQQPELLVIPANAPTHTEDGLPYADLLEVIKDRADCFAVEAARWLALLNDPKIAEFTKRDIRLSFKVMLELQNTLDRLKIEHFTLAEENI